MFLQKKQQDGRRIRGADLSAISCRGSPSWDWHPSFLMLPFFSPSSSHGGLAAALHHRWTGARPAGRTETICHLDLCLLILTPFSCSIKCIPTIRWHSSCSFIGRKLGHFSLVLCDIEVKKLPPSLLGPSQASIHVEAPTTHQVLSCFLSLCRIYFHNSLLWPFYKYITFDSFFPLSNGSWVMLRLSTG
jgi:hypothetical protein